MWRILRSAFHLPYPRNRVSAWARLLMIRDVATWEPVELQLGRYKILWGGLLLLGGDSIIQRAHTSYGWMGITGIRVWGALYLAIGVAQIWANIVHQSRKARKAVMFVTEPVACVFAGCYTVAVCYHHELWWSIGLIIYWSQVVDALFCLRRLGALHDHDEEPDMSL